MASEPEVDETALEAALIELSLALRARAPMRRALREAITAYLTAIDAQEHA